MKPLRQSVAKMAQVASDKCWVHPAKQVRAVAAYSAPAVVDGIAPSKLQQMFNLVRLKVARGLASGQDVLDVQQALGEWLCGALQG